MGLNSFRDGVLIGNMVETTQQDIVGIEETGTEEAAGTEESRIICL
jgi:hypothetical protein